MKSLLLFTQEFVKEIGELNGVSTIRDCKTISDRVESEGISFLTITLPAFCRDFESSLASECISDNAFPGFRRNGALPAFLGGLLSLIFDSKTGDQLENPSSSAIRGIRQITLLFSKILLECSPMRVKKAFDGYLQIEEDVRESDSRVIGSPNMAGFSHGLPYFSSERSASVLRAISTMVQSFPNMDLDPTWINYVETRSGFILVGPNGLKHTFHMVSTHRRAGWTVITLLPASTVTIHLIRSLQIKSTLPPTKIEMSSHVKENRL